MSHYILDKEYNQIVYRIDELNHFEFEACTFINCDFSACNFHDLTFIDCNFTNCNFSQAQINHVKFRTVFFNSCQFKEVNFAMCDQLIFQMHFKDCILDFAKMYALKLKQCTFYNSSLIAVDFMKADVSGISFAKCDLYRAEFDEANAQKSDFSSSTNYTINPKQTKIKKAIFSLEGAKGLLSHHQIIVE
ncbi:pentapeptide repeat-containing protein [Flavobacterium sp. SM2513]|uniref:pentapeptide repeat-containing protein n=1 Tax=Flavobacterium sp. SM2513 TaxID=3424766 RepID=UPI003D7FDEF1